MNRPYTGPMQFQGEMEAGLYLSPEDVARIIARKEDAARLVASLINRAQITSPQRARLEE